MRQPRLKRDSASVALVMVLVTLAIISTVVIEIMYRSQVTATVVSNRRDSEKAYELARAAVRWSVFRLQLDQVLDNIPVIPGTNYGGKKDDLGEFQWAVPLPYPFSMSAIAGAMGGGSASGGESKDPDQKAKEVQQMEALGGTFISTIHDASAKIDLNDVGSGGFGGQIQWSGTAEVLDNLLMSPRFRGYFRNTDHRNVLWAMDDWTDLDGEVNHLGGGVEDVEYMTDDKNLHIKNGSFYSLEEVRLLKPMTDDLFRELEPFVTVYPFGQNYRSNGAMPQAVGVINVNTAPLELIAALFSNRALAGDQDRLLCAQNLVKYRKTAVFRTKDDFKTAAARFCKVATGTGTPPLFSLAVDRVLSTSSQTFEVEAVGSAGDIERTIRTVLSRRDAQKPPKILYWKVI